MICGVKWRGCDCSLFSYDHLEDDRLDHMRVPLGVRLGGDIGLGSPRVLRPGGLPAAVRPRPQHYDDELLIRRIQEERDEHLARRLQSIEDRDDGLYMGRIGGVVGMGNHGGHYMNEDYRRGHQTMLVPQPPAFDRPAGADYVVGVNRARGVRASSLERRLAERLENRSGSGQHRPMMGPPPPGSPHHVPHPPHPPHPSHPSLVVVPPHPMSPPHQHGVHPVPPMGPPPLFGIPPPGLAGGPLLRRHTMEEDLYNSSRMTRPSERVVPGRIRHDYASEAAIHAPASRIPRNDEPKGSMLAGLTGLGRGMNRVYEWRNHVEPGVPEGETAATPA
jgi:hypothetical protein